MPKTFRPYQPDQVLLLPPALGDWVPEGHLARFVIDVVHRLDLQAIEDTYEEEERGAPPYHPRLMVKVLLYAYATGTYSSRRIAAKLDDSVAFRFLAADNRPDFRTISDFRKRHGAALAALFSQVLRLCQKAGLVKLGRVAIDGTKVKANASKHKAMSYGRMKRTAAALEQEVATLLRQAEQTDAEEDRRYGPDRRGDELPAELAHREGRLNKIREAMAALQAEAREEAQAAGKDPRGAEPPDTAQRNFTDPDSRVQKQGRDYVQGYNAQVAVAPGQVIVAQTVTAVASDVQELVPLVQQIPAVLRRKPKQAIADAGYWSAGNVERLERLHVEPFIATQRHKHTDPRPPAPRGRLPAGLSAKERMTRKLLTLRGRAVYAWRQILPEPVFGQIKHARGFRQFLRRGLARVREEWAMVCTVHNLVKLYQGAR